MLLALGGGAVWGLQFGEHGYVAAPWLALAPLFLLLGGPRPAFLGFLHGLAAWLTAIPWITPTLVTFGKIPVPLAVLGLVLLCAYLGAFHALFAALGARVWRLLAPERRGSAASLVAVLLGLPALWISLEWIREWFLSGFPWNLTAYSWIEVPGALAAASWVGAWGLGWVVAFANTGVALAVRRRRWEPAAAAVLLPALLLVTAGRWSGGEPVPVGPLHPVRLLQPNIPNLPEYDAGAVEANLAKMIRMTEEACDRRGALILWPESAAWPYSYSRHEGYAEQVRSLAARGCPLLFNSSHKVEEGGEERWYNSAFLVSAKGQATRYDKRHLVPFGEYVPFGGLVAFVDRLARNAGDFSPAREIVLLPWGRERLGAAICFEITFPGEVAETVREGATVLVTLTNDAWYGDTSAPWQHLRAARFRAAETRRPVLRAAITGVSAVIAPDGSVRGSLGVGEEGTLRAWVSGRRDRSPAVRWSWLWPSACLLTAVLALAFAIVRDRFKGPLPAAGPPEP